MGRHLEREVSFDVGERWSIPDLGGLVPDGGRIVPDQADLHAEYLDTDNQVLRRLGVTLRRRTGGGDAGWHLKVPSGSARLEVSSRSRGRWVPASLAEPLRGVLVDRPLRQLATINTDRRILSLRDADDELAVEIADDRVSATAEGRPASRWREVEAELGPSGSEQLLRAVSRQLGRAGARRSAIQVKLDRAMGPLDRPVGNGSAALVIDYVCAQVAEVLRGDIALRLGSEPDAVHDMRVAIRRIRSVVRAYRAVFEHTATGVATELRWLGSVLGEIRDLDVLVETVKRDLAVLPPEQVLGPVEAGLDEAVALDRLAALQRWHDARDGDRYRRLLAELVDWLELPPVSERSSIGSRRVLKRAHQRLRRRLAAAESRPAALHRARKAAKRLRYAAELAAPGSAPARRTAKTAKKMQRLLGAHQDRLVAQTYLRGLGSRFGTTPGHNGYTYGLLSARADQQAGDLRRKLRQLEV